MDIVDDVELLRSCKLFDVFLQVIFNRFDGSLIHEILVQVRHLSVKSAQLQGNRLLLIKPRLDGSSACLDPVRALTSFDPTFINLNSLGILSPFLLRLITI